MSIKQQHTHKSGGIRNSQPEVNFSNSPLLGFSLIQVGVIRQGGHLDFNGELLSFFPTPPVLRGILLGSAHWSERCYSSPHQQVRTTAQSGVKWACLCFFLCFLIIVLIGNGNSCYIELLRI